MPSLADKLNLAIAADVLPGSLSCRVGLGVDA